MRKLIHLGTLRYDNFQSVLLLLRWRLCLRNGVYVSLENSFECQLEDEQLAVQDGLQLLEYAPQQRPLLDEVHEGLVGRVKSLPAKLHYDQRGSMLFEEICELDEYYITRIELALIGRYLMQLEMRSEKGVCLLSLAAVRVSKQIFY